MKSKLLAIFAATIMVTTCLALFISTNANGDGEPQSFTVTDSTIPEKLGDNSQWITIKKSTSVYGGAIYTATYNPEGDPCTVVLSITSGEFNMLPSGTSHDFVVGAGCMIQCSNTNSHGYHPNVYFNIGRNNNDNYVNLVIQAGGEMRNVGCFGLVGSITVEKGGIYDDNNQSNGSIYMRNDSKIVINEGAIIKSMNPYCGNESPQGTVQYRINTSFNNITAGKSESNETAEISCSVATNYMITLSGLFKGIDGEHAKIVLSSVDDSNNLIVFDNTAYQSVEQISLEKVTQGKLMIDADPEIGFVDWNTLMVLNSETWLIDRVISKEDVSMPVVMRYTWKEPTGEYATPDYYFGTLTDDGVVAEYASITLVGTEGISSISVAKEMIHLDTFVLQNVKNTLRLDSITSVKCESGWHFGGWYYIDQYGLEQRASDKDLSFESGVSYVFYAKAIQDQTDNTPIYLGLTAALMLLFGAILIVNIVMLRRN